MSVVGFITDFADQALLLPVAAVVAALFLLAGWTRGALAWVAAVGVTFAAMLVLKLLMLSCGANWYGPGLNSPSGHTAAGTMVYGGLLAMTIRRRWAAPPAWCGASLVVAVLFGGSRLLLGVHSAAEVLLGGLVGLVGATGFVLAAGTPARQNRPRYLPAAIAVSCLMLHGIHMPAEAAIRDAAARFAWLCPHHQDARPRQ